MYCPRCLKNLGAGKLALPRHRKQCDFLEGTPWGSWQERFQWVANQQNRTMGDAYASIVRILFFRLARNKVGAGYIATQHKQLQEYLGEVIAGQAELKTILHEAPRTPLGPDGAERFRGHRTSAVLIEARLDEVQTMASWLEANP